MGAMVSEIFDPGRWRAVEGFSFTDITYHRAVDSGTVRVAFNRAEVRNAFRPHTVDELLRTRIFADDWEQASHNGELAHAVEAGTLVREQVTELGAVLDGTAEGRRGAEEITAFDSTGLAIQDLAIALAALERADELALQALEL